MSDTGATRPIRIKISQFPAFQAFFPSRRSAYMMRVLAYWHRRLCERGHGQGRYVYPYKWPRIRDRTARARAYVREYRRKHKHAPVGQWPRTYTGVQLAINHLL